MMKILRINRKRWLRGSKSKKCDSTLYAGRSMDKGCCLGHLCHFIYGVPWSKLKDKSFPRDLSPEDCSHELAIFLSENPYFQYKASSINDIHIGGYCYQIDDTIYGSKVPSEMKRESLLKKLFKKVGIKLEFYN